MVNMDASKPVGVKRPAPDSATKDGAKGMTGAERNAYRVREEGKKPRGRPAGVKNGEGRSSKRPRVEEDHPEANQPAEIKSAPNRAEDNRPREEAESAPAPTSKRRKVAKHDPLGLSSLGSDMADHLNNIYLGGEYDTWSPRVPPNIDPAAASNTTLQGVPIYRRLTTTEEVTTSKKVSTTQEEASTQAPTFRWPEAPSRVDWVQKSNFTQYTTTDPCNDDIGVPPPEIAAKLPYPIKDVVRLRDDKEGRARWTDWQSMYNFARTRFGAHVLQHFASRDWRTLQAINDPWHWR